MDVDSKWQVAQKYERLHWLANKEKISSPIYREKIAKRSKDLMVLLSGEIDILDERLKIVEIGGGATQLIDHFPQKVRVGVDPLAELYTSEFADVIDDGVAWHEAPCENLPFDNDEFDVLIVRNVLDHVSDLDRVLSEMRRVVRPEGLVYVGINVFSGLLYLYRNINKNKEHPYVFSHNKIENILRRNQFTISKVVRDAPEQMTHFQDIVNESGVRSLLRKAFLKMDNYHFSEFLLKV
jgi:ubiquinone/menaquinone biosynthesis C-methylase UbiE